MGCRAACKVSYYNRIPRGGRTETWPPLIGGAINCSARITRHSERAAPATIADQLAPERKQGIMIVQKSSSGRLLPITRLRPGIPIPNQHVEPLRPSAVRGTHADLGTSIP